MTLREQIYNVVKTALKNGRIKNVRGPLGRPVSKNDLPVIIVRDNGATAISEERTNGHTRELHYIIRAIIGLQENSEINLFEVIQDIMTALGKAEDELVNVQRLTEYEILYDEDSTGIIDNELLYEGVEINITIRYVAERWKV